MPETPADRLKKIREERFETAAQAQRAIGVAYATYAAHENGSREISRKFAIRYASFYKIRLDWLLTGTGEPRSEGYVQQLFDELPPEVQAEALKYLEFLRREYLETRETTAPQSPLAPRPRPRLMHK